MAGEKACYVGIGEPAEVRREILLASKAVIGILKSSDEFMEMRREKFELTTELKRRLDELAKLNRKLSLKLPKAGIKRPKEDTTKQPAKKTEIDLLEEELSRVEAKLKGLE